MLTVFLALLCALMLTHLFQGGLAAAVTLALILTLALLASPTDPPREP